MRNLLSKQMRPVRFGSAPPRGEISFRLKSPLLTEMRRHTRLGPILRSGSIMEALGSFMREVYWYLATVSLFIFLIIVIPTAVVVRERIAYARKQHRNWFKINLVSFVLTLLVSVTLITANAIPYEVKLGSSGLKASTRGFPLPFQDYGGDLIGLFATWNILVGTGVALAVLFTSESIIRSRQLHPRTRKAWGLALESLSAFLEPVARYYRYG